MNNSHVPFLFVWKKRKENERKRCEVHFQYEQIKKNHEEFFLLVLYFKYIFTNKFFMPCFMNKKRMFIHSVVTFFLIFRELI